MSAPKKPMFGPKEALEIFGAKWLLNLDENEAKFSNTDLIEWLSGTYDLLITYQAQMKDSGFSAKDLSISVPTTTVEVQEITTANVAADADLLREIVNGAVDQLCEYELKRNSPPDVKARLDALVDKITLEIASGD
ncbi:hypothetical protein BST61_g1595 [Cercospora zeina]